jgi:ribosomal protein S18 acetylase RimI-like enzyme
MTMVERLTPEAVDEMLDVFCDAFHDYPVMRAVAGPGGDYETRLRQLIELFVMNRARRGDPLYGVRDATGRLVGAMTMTAPGGPEDPPGAAEHRRAVWQALGPDAHGRYEAMTRCWKQFDRPDRHHHVNMIGVVRSRAGRGLGRALLDAAHGLADADAASAGVSLTTERPGNVDLYRHLGYEVVGRLRVSADMETWGLFRPRTAAR